MVKSEFISDQNSDSKYNEDLVRVGKNMAWVLDGSSSLTAVNYTKSQSDAIWMVENLDKILLKSDGIDNMDLREIIRSAIVKLRSQFRVIVGKKDIPPFTAPSCSLCITRWNQKETKLEYLILGDCEIAVFEDSHYKLISDNTLKELDKKIINKMKDLQNEGHSHVEAFQKVKPKLIKNRSLMNKEGGYWAFSFDEVCVDNSLIGNISLEKNTKVILSSDGFNYEVGDSRIYPTMKSMLDDILSSSLTSTLKRMRLVESQDPECVQTPRLKRHDDASIIILEFEPEN